MTRIFKVLKGVGIALSLVIGTVLVVGLAFISFSPQFGGKYSDEDITRFKQSEHFQEDHFENLEPTRTSPSFRDLGKLLAILGSEVPEKEPTTELPIHNVSEHEIEQVSERTRVIWFGHSAFLLEIAGKRILIDPMLSDVPAPHPLLGSKRFTEELPIAIEALPSIDAVILSHDHYDHLDYETIQKIMPKVGKYYTPLGVGTHLRAWGVEEEHIVELDWWEEANFHELTFVATPARHFSGRGLSDSKKTLWASWVILSQDESIYFSGDSGYGSHFKDIGDTYGPFDLALMECGQYNDSLPEFAIHMLPEETAQAGIDVKAKTVMPVHWASFSLNAHPWKEPVDRLVLEAAKLHLNLVTPQIGQLLYLDQMEHFNTQWWKAY